MKTYSTIGIMNATYEECVHRLIKLKYIPLEIQNDLEYGDYLKHGFVVEYDYPRRNTVTRNDLLRRLGEYSKKNNLKTTFVNKEKIINVKYEVIKKVMNSETSKKFRDIEKEVYSEYKAFIVSLGYECYEDIDDLENYDLENYFYSNNENIKSFKASLTENDYNNKIYEYTEKSFLKLKDSVKAEFITIKKYIEIEEKVIETYDNITAWLLNN